MRIAHLLGFQRKDEALERRFAQMKARYCGNRDEVDVLNHMRHELDNPWVVGGEPQTMSGVRQTVLETYAKAAGPEAERQLTGSYR